MTSSNDRAKSAPARRVALAALLVLLALIGLTAVGSAPGVCSACHAMRPAAQGLEAGPHSGIACYTCHLDSGAWSWASFKARELGSMYPAALVGRGLSGADDGVADAGCTSCHDNVRTGVLKGKGTRIKHQTCSVGRRCVDCHGSESHGKGARWARQPFMDDCVRCHLKSNATVECDTCHAEKSTAERLAAGPWQVTHGPQWRTTHAMGDLQLCVTCHPSSKCVQCHGVPLPHPVDFGRTHGEQAKAEGAKCADCHDRTSFCDACHKTAMPHSATFLSEHSKVAKSRTDAACLQCHYDYDCAACHLKHTHPGRTDGTMGKVALPKAPKP